jgi:hypothetical protein
MNSLPNHRAEHRFEETSLLAYYLWQKAHCPPGEDLKFWLQAEQQMFGKRDAPSAARPLAAANGKAAVAAKTATNRADAPAGKGSAKSQPKAAKQPARKR